MIEMVEESGNLINKKHQRLIYRRVPEEPKEKRTQNN
jgi:hypothetical protein